MRGDSSVYYSWYFSILYYSLSFNDVSGTAGLSYAESALRERPTFQVLGVRVTYIYWHSDAPFSGSAAVSASNRRALVGCGCVTFDRHVTPQLATSSTTTARRPLFLSEVSLRSRRFMLSALPHPLIDCLRPIAAARYAEVQRRQPRPATRAAGVPLSRSQTRLRTSARVERTRFSGARTHGCGDQCELCAYLVDVTLLTCHRRRTFLRRPLSAPTLRGDRCPCHTHPHLLLTLLRRPTVGQTSLPPSPAPSMCSL